jgi:energy-coupling factor transport system substrate-specific component
MSSPSLTLPPQTPATARNRRLLEILGAVAIAGTYIYLVLNQPTDITGGPGSASALIALSGFLVGAVLLIIGVLPTLPVSTLVLIPVALVLNIVLGQFVGSTLVPFYLDAIGTVLIAVLAGPAAGAATGALSSIVWSFFNPTVLPFAAGAALIGCLAGLAARHGLFRRFYLAPVAGFLAGIIGGVVSAPVAAFVFGGTSGLATGAIVSAFRSMGDTLLAAITKQALISDPMDKAIVFTLVAVLVYALPRRTRLQFPFVRKYRVLADKATNHPTNEPSNQPTGHSTGQDA